MKKIYNKKTDVLYVMINWTDYSASYHEVMASKINK